MRLASKESAENSMWMWITTFVPPLLLLLVQGLSVIDTLMLAMVFPLYSVTNFLEYTGLRTMEQTQDVKVYLLPFAFIAQTATIWVTVLVAFNRYIAVCQPFKAARLCTVVQVRPTTADTANVNPGHPNRLNPAFPQ